VVSPAPGLTVDPVFRRWFPTARPAGAQTRLFCLPHAGAGASSYRDWFARLGPDIDCLPVQLPGRETRLAERPIDDVDELVSELAPVLAAHGGPRFALFGHSMGALIAYATAHRLRESGVAPIHLFVSGSSAPRHRRSERWHTLSDGDLLDRLAELGGMPEGVLAEPELCALLIPILRADVALCERYVHVERPPLSIPITAMAGDGDTSIEGALAEWAVETTAPFTGRLFPGDHFYPPAVLDQVIEQVRRSIAGAP
jgi:surfactin synthase thioesterase subunit